MRSFYFAVVAIPAALTLASCGRETTASVNIAASKGRCNIGKLEYQRTDTQPSKVKMPMLATGPTAAIMMRQQLLDLYAPLLLDAIEKAVGTSGTPLQVISVDDNRPETGPRAQVFNAERHSHIDFVRLNAPYATKFRSEIFIQDSFNFRWNANQQRTELIAPTDDTDVRAAYDSFAADCDLAIVDVDLINPDNSENMKTAIVTYAAGGNLETLPGQILISSAPSQDRLLLDQIPGKSGKEYDAALSELVDDIRDRNPSLTMEQATAQAVTKLSSSDFRNKIGAKISAHKSMKQAYTDVGYSSLELDLYSDVGYKLSEIDHIDEYVQAFHHIDGGNCQIGLLVASPLDAFSLLVNEAPMRSIEDNAFCEHASDLLMQNRDNFSGFSSSLAEANARGCLLRNGVTDRGFADVIRNSRTSFVREQGSIDKGVQVIKQGLSSTGCHDPKIIKLPSFLTINSVNALIVTPPEGTSTVIRPDTNLPLFESAIEKILRDNSVPTISVAAPGLAFGDGNLHCATNVLTRGR